MTTFARLRSLPAGRRRPPTQRADFNVVAIVRAGTGHVVVDFVTYTLKSGVVVWIRPGQIHRWEDIHAVNGTLVLFRPEALSIDSHLGGVLGPTSWRSTGDGRLVRLASDHLRVELDAAHDRPSPDTAVPNSVLPSLLHVLIIRISDGAPQPPAIRAVFTAYAEAVEAHCATSRSVSWYARQLGFSARTLNRATQAAVGRTAKQFVDDRVVLEAKRLLAHTAITVEQCARRLGFDDSANFSKFFRQRAGVTPGAFAVGR